MAVATPSGDQSIPQPGPVSDPANGRRARGAHLISMCVLLGGALTWAQIASAFETGRFLDLKYFWAAGRGWLEGSDPYAGAHLSLLADRFPGALDPFFYPPAALPLLAPLGVFTLDRAATALLAANAAALTFCAILLSRLATRLGFAAPPAVCFATIAALASVFFHPAQSAMVNGQLTILLAMALILFVYGAVLRQPSLQGVGLAILLIKPQFGLAFIIFAGLTPKLRRGAMVGVVTYGALTIAGLSGNPPIDGILGFFRNALSYGALDVNDSRLSAGAGLIAGAFGLSLSGASALAGSLASGVGGWALLRFIRSRSIGEASDPRAMVAVCAFIAAAALFGANHHSADYTLFLVAAPLALTAPRDRPAFVCIAIGYLLIAQGAPLILGSGLGDRAALSIALAWAHTAGLLFVGAGAALVAASPLRAANDGALTNQA